MKSYSTIHSQEISTIYREKWSGTSATTNPAESLGETFVKE
jgi:hypothetical protein